MAFYVLNEKRDNLLAIEQNYGISVFIVPSDEVKGSQAVIERASERTVAVRKIQIVPVKMDTYVEDAEEEEIEAEVEAEEETEEVQAESSSQKLKALKKVPTRNAADGAGVDAGAAGAADAMSHGIKLPARQTAKPIHHGSQMKVMMPFAMMSPHPPKRM